MYRFRDAGNVLRTARGIKVRDAGNVLRTVRRVRKRDAGNVLRTIFTAATIALTSRTMNRTGVGAPVVSQYTICSDGTVRRVDGAAVLETWCSEPLAVGFYEVRATHVSGVVPSGSLNAWLACTTSRTWSVTDNTEDGAPVQGVLTVEIRDVATGTIQATATITISAQANESVGGGGGA